MSVFNRFFLGLALGAALFGPGIASAAPVTAASTTSPFVANSSCTVSGPFGTTVTCTSTFTVPINHTWQARFLSFYCTMDLNGPIANLLDVQFTTNKVVGQIYINPINGRYSTATQQIEFGLNGGLLIYADPGTLITTILQFNGTPANFNIQCNSTLGGLVM